MSREYQETQAITMRRTETVEATTREERTRRAIIEVPRQGERHIWVYREEIRYDAQHNVLQSGDIAVPVHRLAKDIAAESVTLASGATISAAEIMEALPLFFDRWADEDIAASRR